LPVLAPSAVPLLADVRRGGAGGRDRRRGRAHRLLSQRVLLRVGLRPALGGPLPLREPRPGKPTPRWAGQGGRAGLAARPPNAALLGCGGAGRARRASVLRSPAGPMSG